jgi:uncharacterized protein YndB with AHSA1/START domain
MTTTTPIPTTLEIEAPPGEAVLHARRFVRATPAAVFDAWTNPEHIPRWLGPRALTMTVCETDLRVGGAWRFVHRGPDGVDHGFHGRYVGIEPGRRLVSTWVYDGMPQNFAVDVLQLEPVDGGTLVVSTMVHDTVEARDGHIAAGMEGGMVESYERLDELLASLARG